MNAASSSSNSGRILALAIHVAKTEPMRLIEDSILTVGAGLTDDPNGKGRRGVTLLDVARWNDTMEELGVDLPWHTRRANVLVEGLDLESTVGRTVRLGTAELLIHAETVPCGTMEGLHAGLRAALVPDFRGGVYGEVMTAGAVRVGDSVCVV